MVFGIAILCFFTYVQHGKFNSLACSYWRNHFVMERKPQQAASVTNCASKKFLEDAVFEEV